MSRVPGPLLSIFVFSHAAARLYKCTQVFNVRVCCTAPPEVVHETAAYNISNLLSSVHRLHPSSDSHDRYYIITDSLQIPDLLAWLAASFNYVV